MPRFLVVAIALLAAISSATGQTASSEIEAGIVAYKSARYEQAIGHFQKATEMDPRLTIAHLYLAIAHAQQYIPGVESEDNRREGENSIREFKLVLAGQPTVEQRAVAQRGLASLLFNLKQFDQAKDAYEELIRLDPTDPEPYYSIAVIDWTQSYQPRMELRASMNLQPTDELQVGSACNLLRSMNEKKVEDGIQKLTKAIELRCDYDDAMAYMNLMYREKADYECDDPEQRMRDLKMADEWVDHTMATKKAKAEAAAAAAAKAQ